MHVRNLKRTLLQELSVRRILPGGTRITRALWSATLILVLKRPLLNTHVRVQGLGYLTAANSVPRYITLGRTAQKTALPTFTLLLCDVSSWLLPCDGPHVCWCGRVFTCHWLATAASSGSAIPAFSHDVNNIPYILHRTCTRNFEDNDCWVLKSRHSQSRTHLLVAHQ
jgi:hypothetical protein